MNVKRAALLGATTVAALVGLALPAMAATPGAPHAAAQTATAPAGRTKPGPVTRKECQDGGGRVTTLGEPKCKGGKYDGKEVTSSNSMGSMMGSMTDG